MSLDLDPDGPARREKQMSINFNFLLEHMDAIHQALCGKQEHAAFRTWQRRAEAALAEAKRIAGEQTVAPAEIADDFICPSCEEGNHQRCRGGRCNCNC
jgi:hypothetical protein